MEWRCETMSVVLKCCSQWWNKVLCLWDSWPPFLVPTWNETIENCSSGIVLEVMRFCNGSVALANPQGINPYQISAPSYLFFWCNGEESPACSLIKLILLQPYCLWNSNMFFFLFILYIMPQPLLLMFNTWSVREVTLAWLMQPDKSLL